MRTRDVDNAGLPLDGNLLGNEFIARIAQGERAAENEFVTQYFRGIHVLVRRHTRPGDPQVDDIVQDVLRNVLEKLRAGALRDPAALPAYVLQAVVFAASAEYRRRKRRGDVGSETAKDAVDSGPGPEDVDAADRRARAVQQLLLEMKVPRDREVLRLFYLEERARDEVCGLLGIEVTHFNRVTHRARERFRELLLNAGFDSTT